MIRYKVEIRVEEVHERYTLDYDIGMKIRNKKWKTI